MCYPWLTLVPRVSFLQQFLQYWRYQDPQRLTEIRISSNIDQSNVKNVLPRIHAPPKLQKRYNCLKTRSHSLKKTQLHNLNRMSVNALTFLWRQVSGNWEKAAQTKGNLGDLNSPTHTSTCPLQSENTLIATSTHHIWKFTRCEFIVCEFILLYTN